MSTNQIQEKLHKVVDSGDSRLLKMLYAVAKEYTDENYTLPGRPMTEKVMKMRVLSARQRIQSGRFTTQADLEKEIKGW
jgi:hypothetical protein